MKANIIRISVVIIVFALFGFYISRNIPTILMTFNTTSSHLTGFFFIALLFMMASFYFIVSEYEQLFEMIDMHRTKWEFLKLQLQAIAANVIIPTAGLSMAAIYAENTKEGESRAKAVSGVLMAFIADYTAISSLLVIVLGYLYVINSLSLHVGLVSLFFLFLTFFFYFLSYISLNKKSLAKKILLIPAGAIAKISTIFIKKKVNTHKFVNKFLTEFAAATKAITSERPRWFKAVGLVLLAHTMRVLTLFVIFAGLGISIKYGVVLAGYAVGVLFIVVSPTPDGVGFVEGSMALTYTSFGIPANAATTAVLLYRALQFWLPFLIGFIILQRERIQKITDEMVQLEE